MVPAALVAAVSAFLLFIWGVRNNLIQAKESSRREEPVDDAAVEPSSSSRPLDDDVSDWLFSSGRLEEPSSEDEREDEPSTLYRTYAEAALAQPGTRTRKSDTFHFSFDTPRVSINRANSM